MSLYQENIKLSKTIKINSQKTFNCFKNKQLNIMVTYATETFEKFHLFFQMFSRFVRPKKFHLFFQMFSRFVRPTILLYSK